MPVFPQVQLNRERVSKVCQLKHVENRMLRHPPPTSQMSLQMHPPPTPVRVFFQLAAKVRMSRKCLPRSDSRQCCRPPRQKCTQLRQSCSKSHSRLVRPSLTKDNIFFFCFIYFPFSFIFMFFYFSAQMYHTTLLFSLFSLPTSTQKQR